MHELSIAQSIIDLATEEAERRGSHVNAVYLKLGALSGVVRESLLFAYGLACEQTPLEGSQLVIEDVPVVVHCPQCNEDRTIETDQWFSCPVCGRATPEIIHGRELEIRALELEQ